MRSRQYGRYHKKLKPMADQLLGQPCGNGEVKVRPDGSWALKHREPRLERPKSRNDIKHYQWQASGSQATGKPTARHNSLNLKP